MNRPQRHSATGADPVFAVVIPVYNHPFTVSDVVRRVLKQGYPVIVVDDGSTDVTPHKLSSLDGVTLVRHPENLGKGAALASGFDIAAGFADFVITLDADGQHFPEDIPPLVRAIPTGEKPLIIGKRTDMTGAAAPWTSRMGRGFSNFWILLSGGPMVRDSQSGFRIYPLPEAVKLNVRALRYQYEVEVLVKAHRAGMRVLEVPVRVSYRPGQKRISHFRPFIDFLRNSATFSRLIFRRCAGLG